MHKRCALSHFCENSLTLVCGICYLRWTKWADEGILHFWKSHKCQICKIYKSQMYQLKTFRKFPPNSSVRLNWLDAATAQHGIPQPPGEDIFYVLFIAWKHKCFVSFKITFRQRIQADVSFYLQSLVMKTMHHTCLMMKVALKEMSHG